MQIKKMTTRKSLGQNFLTNKNKIREIVAALGLEGNETVIEIGPGHGELTRELIKTPLARFIAIEKDPALAVSLKRNFQLSISNFQTPKIEIMEGDALKILPSLIENCKLKIENYKVVGNIPFYITGFLLRVLSELEPKPERIVLTVQKEVAARIAARPPKMNLLAASVQFWAEPEITGIIPKSDFSPQPKVDSAILKITPKKTGAKPENYYPLIKTLFKQPRKTILNNLLAGYAIPKEKLIKILELANINPNDRPQNLGLNNFFNFLHRLETGSD